MCQDKFQISLYFINNTYRGNEQNKNPNLLFLPLDILQQINYDYTQFFPA